MANTITKYMELEDSYSEFRMPWRVFDQYEIITSPEDGEKYITVAKEPGNIGRSRYPYFPQKGSRIRGLPDIDDKHLLPMSLHDLIWLNENLDSEGAILYFVEIYGLLGLLHHNVTDINLYPEFAAIEELEQLLVPIQTTYVNGKDSWHTVYRKVPEIDQTYINKAYAPDNIKAHNIGDPVRWEVSHGGRGIGDHKILTDKAYVIKKENAFLSGGDKYPLGEGLREFFPIPWIREGERWPGRTEHSYPMPNTLRFWSTYCEKLDSFKFTIRHLVHLMEQLSKDNKDDDSNFWNSDLNVANDTWNMSTIIDGKIVETIGFCSMLGLFAYGVMESIARGHGIQTCMRYSNKTGYCGIQFIQDPASKLYCSDRCRHAETTRVASLPPEEREIERKKRAERTNRSK